MPAPTNKVVELPRNNTGLKYQMYTAIAGIIIFWIIAIRIIRYPFQLMGSEFLSNVLVNSIILGLILIIVVVSMQRSWQKRSYFLRGNMLVVAQKNPWTGAVDENIYRLDTVVSARVKQGILGKRNGFGDIILTVPKLESSGTLVLKDIEHPRETVIKINEIVDKSGTAGLTISS